MHSQHIHPSIILYQHEACPYCKRAREALNVSGVPFYAIPVEKDKTAREALRQATHQEGVPYFIDLEHDFESGDTDKIIEFVRATYPVKKEFKWS